MEMRKTTGRAVNLATLGLILVFCIVLILGIIKLSGEGAPAGPAGPTQEHEDEDEVLITVKSDPAAKNGTLPGFTDSGKKNAEDIFSYRINSKPVFKTATAEGDIMLENPAENKHYLQVDYDLAGGDLIYRSGYIKPGQYIETAKLRKELGTGEHEAIASLFVISYDTLDVLEVIEVPITLYVGVKK